MEEKNIDEIKVEILPDDHTQYDLSFKMIIIGDPGVGKSCLTTQVIKSDFDDAYSATIGFEFVTLNLKLDEKRIKMQIWDTCGQEIYRSLISNFYRNASLAMIVYSIDSKVSFSHLDIWLKDVQLLSNPDVKIFLIGNKLDLENIREVSFDEGKKYANEHNVCYFNEASAKNGLNAKEVFIQAAKVLYLDYLKYKNKGLGAGNRNSNSRKITIPMKKHNKNNRKKEGCCQFE